MQEAWIGLEAKQKTRLRPGLGIFFVARTYEISNRKIFQDLAYVTDFVCGQPNRLLQSRDL